MLLKTSKYKYILHIDGMKCSMCETHINKLINQLIKVKKVKSDYIKGEAIIYSDEQIDVSYLKNEIRKTGYLVTKVECL